MVLHDIPIRNRAARDDRSFAEITIAPSDRALQPRIARDDHRIAEHRVGADDGVCFDDDVAPENQRRDQARLRVDAATIAHPDAGLDLLAGNVDAHASR